MVAGSRGVIVEIHISNGMRCHRHFESPAKTDGGVRQMFKREPVSQEVTSWCIWILQVSRERKESLATQQVHAIADKPRFFGSLLLTNAVG
jgi:hypothetical protein